MLETEDVDDDYFTPVQSTSLANIFGSSARQDSRDNKSLKYIPSKTNTKNDIPKTEEVSSKATECVFACALLAYEWSENIYKSRGKVGFAIIKATKTNVHNMVLYDATKSTLSSVTVTPILNVTVKGSTYLSYFDNARKYWSIYATEEEICTIFGILNNLNAKVIHSTYSDNGPPEPLEANEDDKESDDSTLNKTKQSILNRMANMGQSVLPQALPIERTSDSSDTNDSSSPVKPRHKPVKSIIKRLNTDNAPETVHLGNNQQVIAKIESNPSKFYTYTSGQLTPIKSSDMSIGSEINRGSDANLFFSEQRMSNTELRININRVTDKVDQILDKIKDLKYTDEKKTSDFQMDILQKLLTEYENKIKMYEEIINLNNISLNQCSSGVLSKDKESKTEDDKISELQSIVTKKDIKINKLEEEIKSLNTKLDVVSELTREEKNLQNEITNLRQAFHLKQEALDEVSKMLEGASTAVDGNSDIANKLKSIMNDTFQTISLNFEDDVNYSGQAIKNIVAKIIMKITMEELKN